MMTWVWRAVALLGVLLSLLGGLWLAQGLGVVHIDPIACVGACEPVEAPSRQWQLTGGVTALVGTALTFLAVHRMRKPE